MTTNRLLRPSLLLLFSLLFTQDSANAEQTLAGEFVRQGPANSLGRPGYDDGRS